MKIIKRYANRKLYDTEDKKYVSLADIRELIRQGADIQVIDNESGDDITSLTLSQIIYETEKRKESLLPPSILKNLILSGGTTMFDSVRKLVHTGIGAARLGRDEVERTIKRFLRTGEISEKEARELQAELEELNAQEEELTDAELERRVSEVLERKEVVRKADLAQLSALVADLESKLNTLLDKEQAERGF